MKKMIDLDNLFNCNTCYFNNDGKCSPNIWCENGERYRPDYSKLKIVENNPLTLDELYEVSESEEYGAHIWVKDLIYPYDIVACVTDFYLGEVIAVWSAEQWYRGREYGETWVAYRYKPDKED